MNTESPEMTRLVRSYITLRVAVGLIGMVLPFVLAIGKSVFDGPGLLSSISGYYYSSLRDVFVGAICAVAVFLMTYRGYERADSVAGIIACISAIGLAWFPTSPAIDPTAREMAIGRVHLGFAAAFFLTLAFFSLFLFRKTNPLLPPTPRKLLRNKVYAICGAVIVLCLILIVVCEMLPPDSPLRQAGPVFWLEAVADVAFGVSWLTKGNAFLEDHAIFPVWNAMSAWLTRVGGGAAR